MSDREAGHVRMLGWWREVFALHSPHTDTFTAPPTRSAFARLYGGQVAAQSMLAAAATVDDGLVPHSQHTSFLRGGDTAEAVTYRVNRIRDSRAMSTRMVTAEQSGRVLATSIVSFHQIAARAEHAFEHEWPSPTAEHVPPTPHPDSLPSRAESLLSRYGLDIPDHAADIWPVDMRYVERTPWSDEVSAPRNRLWLRSIQYPDIPGADPAALAFATDLPMFEPVFFPTGIAWSQVMSSALVLGSSLDHSIWFHRPARLDDWLLLDLFAPVAHASRAFIRGELRAPSGQLVASVAQEVVFVNPRKSRGSP